MSIPTGEITFLFTDIEGSTKLAQEFPDTLQSELEKHHSILKEVIESNNGFIFEIIGDAFCAAFKNPADAVRAACEGQVKLNQQGWNEIPVKVRIGVHTGTAEWNGKRYIGYITLARTQRVMSVAFGGQILISNETYNNAIDTISNKISFRDLGERRLKDLIQPLRIYQAFSFGLRSDFPPLKTLDARPNNLPVQLTNFIGREKEIEEIKNLLSNTHLLTLVGPGGTGKTRLCLQVAADIIDDFENGVWFVDLAPLKDETLLQQTIAQTIGVIEKPKTGLLDTILEYLKEKESLILLDNCEHIIESCSRLVETLLTNCPGIKIIATSRETLRCNGEVIYYVDSLNVPDLNEKISLDKLSQYESVKFFIERALAVRPGFRVNNTNAPSVAEICFRLDGIPLAIELAAAKVKVLSVEQICKRLNDRFNLLISGNRTALPRQQTLKALIDWSYDLLSEKEKTLWRRLSFFAGGWTIEAAEEICSDDLLRREEVLEILTHLVDKSLIIYNEETQRYRMLETIRQYGEDGLNAASELDKIISKHLDFYLELAEIAKSKLSGNEQKKWMDNLDIDNSNFQVALRNSIVKGKRQIGIHLAVNLCRYWETRGHITQAKNLLIELLNTADEIPAIDRANALQWWGTFEWVTGNYSHSKILYEESFRIHKHLNNTKGIAVSLNNLGMIANVTGAYEESKILTEQSYSLFREMHDKPLQADSLLNLAAILINLNQYDKAKLVYEECLRIYREIGDSRGIGMILTNIGTLFGLTNEYNSSRTYLEEGLSIQRELNDKRTIARTLSNLGAILSYLGYNSKAKEYLEESIKINTELGDKKVLSNSMNILGFVKYSEGDIWSSIYYHKESLKLLIEISNMEQIWNCIVGIAEAMSLSEQSKAAQLLGAINAAFHSIHEKLDKEFQIVYERTLSTLSEKLGEEKFLKYFKEGSEMTEEQAIGLALKIDSN